MKTTTTALLAAATLASCGTELMIEADESALAPAGSSASLLSHTVPAAMAPGESRQVEVVMMNDGTVAWDTLSWVLRNRGAGTWSYPQISVVPTVDPGESFAFRFLLTAPTNLGPFLFRAKMMNVGNGYFGPVIEIPVDVSNAVVADLSAVVDNHDLPVSLFPGEKRRVHLTMRNNGTRTWDGLTHDLRRSGSEYFGWVSTVLPAQVLQDEMHQFSFVITAPQADGFHIFSTRMYRNDGVANGYFGERLDHSITVSSALTPERWWAESSDTVPAVISPNAPASFTITVQNTGSLPWVGSNYGLNYFTVPRTSWARGMLRLGAAETVAPGQTRTFTINMVGPPASGSFDLTWEMMETGVDSVASFGPRGVSTINIGVPETNLVAPACDVMRASTQSFTFSSSSPGATFECSVDGAGFSVCASPYLTPALADGAHTFQVRAVEGIADPTPASFSWTIDQGFMNGSFESNYCGWTFADGAGQAQWGVWGIGTAGQTVSAGNQVFDYADAVNVSVSSPGLPLTFAPTDGNRLAFMLVGGPLLHRLRQDAVLPACGGTLRLNWDMRYRNHNPGGWSATNQYLRVNLRDPANNALLVTLFNAAGSLNVAMTAYSYDISAYAGQQVRVEVEINAQTFYLDFQADDFNVTCE